jgi:predicted AAA+ superfamily ATPase
MYSRIYDEFDKYLQPGKVSILLGARQIGKSTLIRNYLSKLPANCKYRLESGDNVLIHEILSPGWLPRILTFAEDLDLLVIDEAQRIPRIGLALKMLIDHQDKNKPLSILISGSSSFELSGQVGEPLTGRKRTLPLYPISLYELRKDYSVFELQQRLADFLVYGMYPDVLNAQTQKEKQEQLRELAGSYLLKDILELDRIKGSKVLLDLLRLIAWQTGNEVSYSELGQKLSLDNKTVARYLDLLEKAFVLFQVRPWSSNLRKEINKKSKYYFYDTGLRNVLITDFNMPDQRNDIGFLWENFMMAERIKTREYSGLAPGFNNESRFWRTWDQKEIDLIEQRGEELYAFEFKWGKGKNAHVPKDFAEAYPHAKFTVITPENWPDFLLPTT